MNSLLLACALTARAWAEPDPTAKSPVAVELGAAWSHPVLGHASFGNGYAVSGRLAYAPRPDVGVAFELRSDYACSITASDQTWCWFRGLVGARFFVWRASRWDVVLDTLAGVDYVASENAREGFAAAVGGGPRYHLGDVFAGIDASFIYSHVWNYDTEGGHYADPSGTFAQVGVVFGVTL